MFQDNVSKASLELLNVLETLVPVNVNNLHPVLASTLYVPDNGQTWATFVLSARVNHTTFRPPLTPRDAAQQTDPQENT